ncbi:hypothetical protein CF326_g640 [Tilletia indica]|nr:hypothetical protein CF326_g640 [Tilletia indica]
MIELSKFGARSGSTKKSRADDLESSAHLLNDDDYTTTHILWDTEGAPADSSASGSGSRRGSTTSATSSDQPDSSTNSSLSYLKHSPPAYRKRPRGCCLPLALLSRCVSSRAASINSRMSRRTRRIVIVLVSALLLALLKVVFVDPIFRPPSYIVLPRSDYISTLNHTLSTLSSPFSTQQALANNLQDLAWDRPPNAATPPNGTLVPNLVWSSDKAPAEQAWFEKWKSFGGDPQFLDDAAAEAWVAKNFGASSPVRKAWDDMPRMILKADFLRYLLLLVEGGTWSDMDTVPLMSLEKWASNAVPLLTQRRATPGVHFFGKQEDLERLEKGPVRLVVGLETDPTEWWLGLGALLELLRLKALNRHRVVQMVQWTLHSTPSHPVLLDATRRVIEATDVYRSNEIERAREAQRSGWGWHEDPVTDSLDGSEEVRKTILARPGKPRPWMSTRLQWVWRKSGWKLGWPTTSVEEWTGPAVWTDAVISYLWAVYGVRPEDLTRLQGPARIGDVVVLPTSGFAPQRRSVPNDYSRIIHLFRGSWKV